MKTAWIFQHVPFEGPGVITPWLLSCNVEVKFLPWWEQPSPPDPEDVGLVIAMGGPMSVNEPGEHPWMVQEKTWLLEYMHLEKPVLGVCLGAQLMASALGAEVKPNPEPEIGWWPVEQVNGTSSDPLTVLHWHGETFDLPEGAVHLERSKACEHQSFRWGDRAVGLQYHLEATPESLNSLISNCRDELRPAEFIQTEEQLLAGWERHHKRAEAHLHAILTQLTAS